VRTIRGSCNRATARRSPYGSGRVRREDVTVKIALRKSCAVDYSCTMYDRTHHFFKKPCRTPPATLYMIALCAVHDYIMYIAAVVPYGVEALHCACISLNNINSKRLSKDTDDFKTISCMDHTVTYENGVVIKISYLCMITGDNLISTSASQV
jgi:hypothetical protein